MLRKALCLLGFHGYEIVRGDEFAKCPHCDRAFLRGYSSVYAYAVARVEREEDERLYGGFWRKYGDKL